MSMIKLNNSDFYYEIHGQDNLETPLVLIEGFGCDHSIWATVVANLKNKFKILIFDNRGSGQTQDNNKPLTLIDLADDVSKS